MDGNKALQTRNSNNLPKVFNGELSVYGDDLLNLNVWNEQMGRLRAAFPRLDMNWYRLLKEQLAEECFTNLRFIEAVKNLIKTCEYPEPTIAKILNFDRKIKLLTEPEFLKKRDEFGSTLINYYQRVNIEGQLYYAENKDVEKYKLKEWVPKPATEKRSEQIEITDEDRIATSQLLKDAINKIKIGG